MWTKLVVCLSIILAIALLVPSTALGDDWNRLSTAIFNHPVQIPGQVLPTGIYVFKLAEITGEHNIVQIWNADQTILYATIMGLPEYLGEAPSENRFLFEHKDGNSPMVLKSWSYMGDSYAKRFIYSKKELPNSKNTSR